MKLQHPDRVGDLPPADFGDDEFHIEQHKAAGWYEVDDKTGKPKDD